VVTPEVHKKVFPPAKLPSGPIFLTNPGKYPEFPEKIRDFPYRHGGNLMQEYEGFISLGLVSFGVTGEFSNGQKTII
jgi:hypothetical protein